MATRLQQMIPWGMAGLRVAMAPLMPTAAAWHWSGLLMAATVLVALVSDIYDGVLARRWGCDTPAVRLFDSMADTIFYVGVAAAMWLAHPDVFRTDAWLLGVLLALEIARFAFDWAKFGKAASYHTYLAKSWGLAMGIGVIAVLGFDAWKPLLAFSFVLGILCDVEGLAMSVILPEWRNDIKTLARARRIRREMLRS
jgi:CDP-diacylglycerol--glycerol-3-phosphate 3-phosphatidyltransferase